ncbi:MAG TPA: PAS domain S-box protein, partial [Ignavibacteriales bacterium]|nr:PAS domain S-box protein [Ignavibacteriales bacterium]
YLHTGEAALSAQKILNIASIETSVTGSIISCSGDIGAYFPGLGETALSGLFIGDVLEEISIHEFNSIKKEIKETGLYQSIVKKNAGGNNYRYLSVKAAAKDADRNSPLTFIISDITEKMEEERKFRVSESNYRGIVEHSGHFICKLDPFGIITFHSRSVPEYLGFEEDEVIGKSIFEFVDPVYARAKDFNISYIRENLDAKIEIPLKKKNGSIVYVYGGISPIYDLHGEITGYSCVLSDISFLKLTESFLNMKIAVFETAPEGLALECDRKFILANKSFLHLFGYDDASEIVGGDSLDIVGERDIKKVSSFALRRKRESKLSYEFQGKKKNGALFTAGVSSSNYEIDGKIYTASVFHDVPERKHVSDGIDLSGDKYIDLISNMHDFLWRIEIASDKNKNTAIFTPSVINITGYTAEDFAKDKRLWLKLIHPDDIKEFKKKIKLFLEDKLRRTGDIEFRIINKSGKSIWVRTRVLLKRDPQGKIISIYGQTGDISSAKRIEEDLKKSKDDLARVNETKDRFISIISHDLRTPFSSILGFTELLMTEKDISEEQKSKYIGYIHEAGTNILSLVNSVLDWTRLQTGQIKFYPERINAKELADKSINIVMGYALQK